MTVWKYVSICAEKRQWLRGYDFVTKRSDLFVTKFSTGVECVCAGASARGISLRNAPRRNPTCATVSPHRVPRTCGPARRRDGPPRSAHAEPNRQESTGIDGSRACRCGAKLQSAISHRRANRVRSATRCNSIPVDSCRVLSTRLWNDLAALTTASTGSRRFAQAGATAHLGLPKPCCRQPSRTRDFAAERFNTFKSHRQVAVLRHWCR